MKMIIPFGKYKGKDYFDVIKNEEAVRYFHWVRAQEWVEKQYYDFFKVVKSNLPEINVEEVFIRDISEKEKSKNKAFNIAIRNNILQFYVARTWGHRSLPLTHWKWHRLRNVVLNRDNGICRFCKLQYSKYLIVDHLNGDASNNSLENLGVNCRGCDKFRHCGKAGLDKELVLRLSIMEQNEIVRKSYQFHLSKKRNPQPEDIDPDCRKITHFEIKGKIGNIIKIIDNPKKKELHSTIIANVLLKYNYEELDSSIKKIKGFFSKNFDYSFLDHII